MSYANFAPVVWSKHVQKQLREDYQLVRHCWNQFQGDAKLGATVNIQGIEPVTIRKYTNSTDIAAPDVQSGTRVVLNIDQADYFNVYVDSIDEYQSNVKLMEELMNEASKSLSASADSYVASLANGSDATQKSTVVGITTPALAKAEIDKGLIQLRKNNVSLNTKIYIEIPAFLFYHFKDFLVQAKTDNDELVRRGVVGMYDGCEVCLCNNLYTNSGTYHAMLRTEKAIAYADGLSEMEAYKPEKRFGDAVKSLHVYGAKIVRPAELYVLRCKETAV